MQNICPGQDPVPSVVINGCLGQAQAPLPVLCAVTTYGWCIFWSGHFARLHRANGCSIKLEYGKTWFCFCPRWWQSLLSWSLPREGLSPAIGKSGLGVRGTTPAIWWSDRAHSAILFLKQHGKTFQKGKALKKKSLQSWFSFFFFFFFQS